MFISKKPNAYHACRERPPWRSMKGTKAFHTERHGGRSLQRRNDICGTARRRAGHDEHRERVCRAVPGDAAGHGDERRPPCGRQAPHAERGRRGGLFRRGGDGAGHEHARLYEPPALRRVRRHGHPARGPRREFGLLRPANPRRLEQGGGGLRFLRFSQVHGPGLGHPAKGSTGAADGRRATRPGPSR